MANPLALGLLMILPSLSADPPETAVVAFTIAPGEEGSASETVTVSRKGKHTLTLRRKAFKTPEKTETVAISPEEFAAVWSIVEGDKLLDFTPDAPAGTAFDYGERKLRTEVHDSASGKVRSHETSWLKPIKNADRLRRLVPALAKLARTKAKDVQLENFNP